MVDLFEIRATTANKSSPPPPLCGRSSCSPRPLILLLERSWSSSFVVREVVGGVRSGCWQLIFWYQKLYLFNQPRCCSWLMMVFRVTIRCRRNIFKALADKSCDILAVSQSHPGHVRRNGLWAIVMKKRSTKKLLINRGPWGIINWLIVCKRKWHYYRSLGVCSIIVGIYAQVKQMRVPIIIIIISGGGSWFLLHFLFSDGVGGTWVKFIIQLFSAR